MGPPGGGRIRVGGETRRLRWRQVREQGHQPCIPLPLPGIAASASGGSPGTAGCWAWSKVKRQKGTTGEVIVGERVVDGMGYPEVSLPPAPAPSQGRSRLPLPPRAREVGGAYLRARGRGSTGRRDAK